MKLRVIKVGSDMFDALHAYGLGIIVAHASDAPVDVRDEGSVYELYASGRIASMSMTDILAEALALPELGDIRGDNEHGVRPEMTKALSNMDGLLAASYTSPGIRVASLADLAVKQLRNPSSMQRALTKLQATLARWSSSTARRSRRRMGQIEDVLGEYDPDHPAIPRPAAAVVGTAPGVTLSIDPSFGYASRRSHSDGLISRKEIVTVRGTHHAVTLTAVGAARFLRAQCVAGNMVNLYIPLVSRMTVDRDTTLPTLRFTSQTARHAVAAQSLEYARQSGLRDAHWGGLIYQTLQPQGVNAPISRVRGYVDLSWFSPSHKQEARHRETLVDYWRTMLAMDVGRRPYAVDNLVASLLERRAALFVDHLRDVSLYNYSHGKISVYTPTDVKGIIATMLGSDKMPLSQVLSRPHGTLRFGHSLRQLRANRLQAALDVVDDLHSVATSEDLMRSLARAVQECVIASAKSPFMIVPSNTDLEYLLEDVDRYGVREIASVLIILSVLRYPRAADDRETGDVETHGDSPARNAQETEDSSNERSLTSMKSTGGSVE